MKNAFQLAVIAAACISTTPTFAQQNNQSQYAGQEQREIKSLSADDIAELRRGGGWGLAKAAELNGVPGPAHLLELRDDIPLTKDQIATIQTIFDTMKSEAIRTGEKMIALEKHLEQRFQTGDINRNELHQILTEIANTRRDLRFVHLATHLQTPNILSPQQIETYNNLRGYSENPCTNIPQGHDPAMWKQHNGCTD